MSYARMRKAEQELAAEVQKWFYAAEGLDSIDRLAPQRTTVARGGSFLAFVGYTWIGS